MTRMLGFLSGLLVVVVLAVAAVRYPPAGLLTPQVDPQTAEPPIAEAVEASSPAEGPAIEAPQPLERVDDVPPAAVADESAGSEDGDSDPAAAVPKNADSTEAAAVASTAAAPAEPTVERMNGRTDERIGQEPAAADATRQWYTFWQPFHSELSAEGFRRRLEGVTGLDYRVVSPRPGEYQVAFAYRDEPERLENLAAIEAATGLVLRSGML